MRFLKKIGSSIYSPSFYGELLDKPLKYSIKYFFGLILLLSLISTAFYSVILVPGLSVFIGSIKTDVIKYYPEGLEVTIKGGSASTNVTEPYFVKMPKDSQNIPTPKDSENILVIDTTHDFSLEGFNQHNTTFLLTKDALVSKNGDGKISIESLSKFPDVKITRDALSGWIDAIMPFVKVIPFFLPAIIFAGAFLGHVFTLGYLLIAGFLVWLCLKIKKVPESYKKSYQLAIHAFTLSMILTVVLGFLGFALPLFVPTAVLLIVVLINVKKSALSVTV